MQGNIVEYMNGDDKWMMISIISKFFKRKIDSHEYTHSSLASIKILKLELVTGTSLLF